MESNHLSVKGQSVKSSIFHKIGNIWVYAEKVNRIFTKIGLPEPFDTFLKFQSDKYGGDRQWLRCIAQKTL